ncbi:response regulator transcription factor [Novisyntrophococcus fermenticellae]|uniref:response regulator transcription factor n=1 Tax=Novisyntrophococcus fermenticellae TaxID=2068655 RepID=UPI001E317EE6|nr:helix-turn-helix domain-containing protein [Novisyntrophococcus fermenticellae]
MYNLLIVDDEPIILESLYRMVLKQRGELLYVFHAGSAEEALDIFENNQIDLLMTDICMPRIDGIRFRNIVLEKWPDCMTIFLTGQEEFSYAKEAVNSRTIAFVLKVEGDKALLAAIDRGIEKLEILYEEKSRVLRLSDSLEELAPVLKQSLLRDILYTEVWEQNKIIKLQTELKKINNSFSLNREFLLAVCKVEGKSDVLAREKLKGILEKTLKNGFHVIIAFTSDEECGILVQSDVNNPNRLKGFLEIGCRICEKSNLPCPDIFIYEAPVKVDTVYKAHRVIKYRLLEMEESEGIRMCSGREKESMYQWENKGKNTLRNYIFNLEENLMHANESLFFQNLEEIVLDTKHGSNWDKAALFLNVSSRILDAIENYLPDNNDIHEAVNIEKLTNYRIYIDFTSAMDYLGSVAKIYFKKRSSIKSDTKRFLVSRINAYIGENIDTDLSLVSIGNMAGLNPAYATRVYKEITGKSINQYIAEQRVDVAKRMLKNTSIKIQDIAVATGMNTASHFTRFFKKHTGYAPQEYRNKVFESEKAEDNG